MELKKLEPAIEAVEAVDVAVEAAVPAVEAAISEVALDVKAVCEEAQAAMQVLLDKIGAHADGSGLRSTLAFVIGRFEAEKQEFWK
jgi:hypothetical protein